MFPAVVHCFAEVFRLPPGGQGENRGVDCVSAGHKQERVCFCSPRVITGSLGLGQRCFLKVTNQLVKLSWALDRSTPPPVKMTGLWSAPPHVPPDNPVLEGRREEC